MDLGLKNKVALVYADVVTSLASQRASYLTGSMVRVDDGLIGSI